MEKTVAVIKANQAAFSLIAQLSETFTLQNLSTVLKVCKSASFFLGPACIVLDLVSAFLPDEKHEAIMREFNKVHIELESVRDDIKNLETSLKWEATKLKYLDVCNFINTAFEFCLLINQHKNNKAQQSNYKDRLIELCNGQQLTLALNLLMDGLAGTGTFKMSIISSLYDQTRGNRIEIGKMCARLNQLLFCGIVSMLTYETLERGTESAKVFEQDMFSPQMITIADHQSYILHKCRTEYMNNMKEDLKSIMEQNKGTSNRNIVDTLYLKVRRKYDWLEVCCLVYNDIGGFENHCFNGRRVEMLHFHDKCGIIFYRFMNPHIIDRHEIIEKTIRENGGSFRKADEFHKYLADKFLDSCWGLWVGQKDIDPQACNSDVWVIGPQFTVSALNK